MKIAHQTVPEKKTQLKEQYITLGRTSQWIQIIPTFPDLFSCHWFVFLNLSPAIFRCTAFVSLQSTLILKQGGEIRA